MSKTRIKQHDITDCGAACLASVTAFYKLEIPLSKIRQYAGTDKKGTNVLGLLEAAQKLGFDAKGVRGTQESLFKIPKPAIAHLILKNQLHHYVVIYSVSKTKVKIMDPGVGKEINLPLRDFIKQWTGVLVILLPNESFSSRNEKISLLRRFLFLLKPHKYTLFQSLVGSIIYTLLGFSTSIYIQKITDHVLSYGNNKLLNIMSITMIILLIFQILISIFKDIFLVKIGQEIDARLILGYYKHLLKLPQQFFDTMRIGEIISRVNDAVKIRVFISNTSLTLMVNFFIVLFSFMIMFTYYWKLGLLMICIVPVYFLIFLITNYFNKKTERKLMEASADLESQLVESLNAMKTIKQFSLEPYAHIKTENRFIKLLNIGFYSSLNQIFSYSSTQSFSNLFTILLLWIGSYFVISQDLSTGELLSFYAITGYFTGPVSSLISSNKTIQNALIAADRLFEIMDLEREESENKYRLNKDALGDICFKNVTFRYGSRREVFTDFNLLLKKGEISAIIGESGSGKSTLIQLFQSLYPLKRGEIYIGKHNLKYLEKSSLRNIISVVPQKIDLFDGNIIDNIAIGETEIDMEKIIEICKSIELQVFIESLPHGFQTYIGENGTTLSGGQKQKLAIARALYRDPEILILDEATSSLDSYSEKYVQQTMRNLRSQGKTVIVISHRLSTLLQADNIFYLHKGKVIEQGSHKKLMTHNGLYKKLWDNQLPDSQICTDIKT